MARRPARRIRVQNAVKEKPVISNTKAPDQLWLFLWRLCGLHHHQRRQLAGDCQHRSDERIDIRLSLSVALKFREPLDLGATGAVRIGPHATHLSKANTN